MRRRNVLSVVGMLGVVGTLGLAGCSSGASLSRANTQPQPYRVPDSLVATDAMGARLFRPQAVVAQRSSNLPDRTFAATPTE